MKSILLIILNTVVLLTCATEDTRQTNNKEIPEVRKEYSCTVYPLDGECKYYYKDNTVACSMGKCSEGDCYTGKGILSYPNGSSLEANFKKGQIEGNISLKECGSGIHFIGILQDKTRKGKFTYPNGDIFVGTVIYGQRRGKGILTDINGRVYEGNWVNDIRDGKFTIKEKDIESKRVITYIDGKDDEEREKIRIEQLKRETEYYNSPKGIRERERRARKNELVQFINKMYDLGAQEYYSCVVLCEKYRIKYNCSSECSDAMDINR